MNEESSGFIPAVVTFFIIIGLIALFLFWNHEHDANLWNDGRCSCGGYWQYDQAVGHKYSTSYIFRCDKCGSLIEIDYIPESTNTMEVEENG